MKTKNFGICFFWFFISILAIPLYADVELERTQDILYGDDGRQVGTALEAGNGSLYLVGQDETKKQAMAVDYSLPPGKNPIGNFLWADQQASVISLTTQFTDIAATQEDIYMTGVRVAQISGNKKSSETTGFLVKFPLKNFSAGKSIWTQSSKVFPDQKQGVLRAAATASRDGQVFVYTTGHATSGPDNSTAILAKYDSGGKLLWVQTLGKAGTMKKSSGTSLVVLNGAIYIAGFASSEPTSPKTKFSELSLRAMLWKFDDAGNLLWEKELPGELYSFDSEDPLTYGVKVALTVSENHLYLAASTLKTEAYKAHVVFAKYDQNGNSLWKTGWEAMTQERYPAKQAWISGAASGEDRFYVSGYLELPAQKSDGANQDALLLEVDKNYGSVLAIHTYGKADQLEKVFDVTVFDKYVYLTGASEPAVPPQKIKENYKGAELLLLQYTKQKIGEISIDIQPGDPENLIPSADDPAAKEIAVAILSEKKFKANVDTDMTSLTFGRTGNENDWSGCSTTDVNQDGVADLLCYFNTTWKSWKGASDALAAFQAGDNRGILRGQLKSGGRLQGEGEIEIQEASETTPPPEAETPSLPPPVSKPLIALEETLVEETPVEVPSVSEEKGAAETALVEETIISETKILSSEPEETAQSEGVSTETGAATPETGQAESNETPEASAATSGETVKTTTSAASSPIVNFAIPVIGGSGGKISSAGTSTIPLPAPVLSSPEKSSASPAVTLGSGKSGQGGSSLVALENKLERQESMEAEPVEDHGKPGSGLAEAYRDLGYGAIQEKRFDQALIYLNKALEINPKLPEVHTVIGMILMRQGKLEDAKYYFSEALKLDPEDPVAKEKLALILKSHTREEKAATQS